MFGVKSFRLDFQHLALIVFQAQKITLMMSQKKLSQCLSSPGDEAPPAPSTQALPNIDEDREAEAFIEIEEVELQYATNVASTSARAVGSSQNAKGTSLQPPQRVPLPTQVMQEHRKSCQVQVED
jgi:hypothetical protein